MSFSESYVKPLAQVVDEIAATNPDHPFAYIPRSNENIDDGYRPFTFKELSQSVDKLARWIEQAIGVSSSRETIAFMDRSNDLRYVFITMAAQKTGYQVMLTSTRNSVEGQRSLIRKTGCSVFLHGAESTAEVLALQDPNTHFRAFELPSLHDLMTADVEPYPGIPSTNPLDTAIIIHTSGSTGLPKPINLRNAYIDIPGRLNKLAIDRPRVGNLFFSNFTAVVNLPWFHAMGLFAMIRAVLNRGPLVLPPAGQASTADLWIKMIKLGKPDVGVFPPSILEDIVDTPGGLDTLGTLKYALFGGAPLSPDAGKRIVEVTKIVSIIGSTEAGILDCYYQDGLDAWQYFEFCEHTGLTMEPAEDLHEAVIKPLDNGIQGAFYSFPDIAEWRTKDLYEQHPTKPALWRYKGRRDDVVVLSSGEKFNPIEFEKYMDGHAAVKSAMVVGEGRFQAGLLLELNKEVDPETFIDEIWPTVEQANELVAAHGRVWKSKIAIVKPGKTFIRAPKGSIVRRQTCAVFKEEIDALYANEGYVDQIAELRLDSDLPAVKETVTRAVRLTLPDVPEDVPDTEDLFHFGVDSLQVLALSSALNHAMPKRDGVRGGEIKARFIYGHPNIQALSRAIHAQLHGENTDSKRTREEKIGDTVRKYTADLPAAVTFSPRQQKHTVILTGSTGSLGNYLLEYLIADPSVGFVYCLNRSDAEARQKQAFLDRGVTPDFSNVAFHQASFGKERFGLSPEVYKELEDNVDIFIHNAWAVDFNMNLESFEETHIMGTRRCIDFSASSRYHPHIQFISSIASTGNWEGSGHTGLVPEVFLEDDSVPLPQGYGESKHVAGRILAAAAEQSGIASSIVRVGQLSGPCGEKGVWNRHEWLPSIISSSKAISKIPRNLGVEDTVDWVPVDAAARTLIDLIHTRMGNQAEKKIDVFHLVNPKTVEWKQLVPAVQEFYAAQGTMIEAIDYNDWLVAMKELPLTQECVKRVPGLKLLDFYSGLAQESGGLPRMATEHTSECSATLKNLEPINSKLIVNWCKQWGY